MTGEIIVDGIIDAIKELKEVAKCPFCDGRLEFERASKEYGWGYPQHFSLSCQNCNLQFSLGKKKNKWMLEEVRKISR